MTILLCLSHFRAWLGCTGIVYGHVATDCAWIEYGDFGACACSSYQALFPLPREPGDEANLRHVGLQHRFFFDVGREEAKRFDVTTGHTQTMRSCHALNYSLGRTLAQEAQILCWHIRHIPTIHLTLLTFYVGETGLQDLLYRFAFIGLHSG